MVVDVLLRLELLVSFKKKIKFYRFMLKYKTKCVICTLSSWDQNFRAKPKIEPKVKDRKATNHVFEITKICRDQ